MLFGVAFSTAGVLSGAPDGVGASVLLLAAAPGVLSGPPVGVGAAVLLPSAAFGAGRDERSSCFSA